MPLISERLPDLLGGVSQKAQTQRDQTQVTRAVNTMAHPALGLLKRPPTRHGAVLSLTPGDWPGAYSFPLSLDFHQRYRCIVTNGEMKAYDILSGDEVTVSFPDGKEYLNTDGANPLAVFRAVSVDGRSYILNRSRVIQQDTSTSALNNGHALVVVRQADFATAYTITLFPSKAIKYTTSAGISGDSRNQISTEEIASELVLRLEADSIISGKYTIEQYGATISISSNDRSDVDIKVSDGLADEGLLLIQGKVKTYDLLPAKAPEGYVVEVESSPTSALDNAWYEFDGPTSTWVETLKPGEPDALYAASMPHELVLNKELIKSASNRGAPIEPEIESVGGTEYVGQLSSTLNGSATGGIFGTTTTLTATDSTDGWYVNLGSVPASPCDVRLYVKFSIDATRLQPGNLATVTLYTNDSVGGTTWTELDQKVYPAGEAFGGEVFDVVAPAQQQNYDIRIVLSYTDTGAAPHDDTQARLRIHQYGHRNPGFLYYVLDTKRITFPDREMYPSGVTYTLTVNSTAFNYTPSADRTGRQMAAAFQALIDADANLSATRDGSAIDVDLASSTAAPTAVWTTNYDPDTFFHDTDLDLTVNELVGYTLQNLATGATGVIASNSPTTIVVSALTGGIGTSGNTFSRGDRIEILDLPDSLVFRQADWKARQVGSVELDPFPPLVGRRAGTIFYHRGRLGITAADFVCLSESGDPRNFFRSSVAALLDSDPIIIKPTKPVGTFHSAISLDDRLFLFTDSAQYELDAGADFLTPTSVRVRKVTDYRSAPQADAVELGRQAVFAYDHFGHAQVELYGALPEAARTYEGKLLTKDVPRYLTGKVRQIAGFDSVRMLFVLTDDTATSVGLPGMTADPFLDLSTAAIPPSPPAPPPPPPNTEEDDVAKPTQQENELLTGAEGYSDADGWTTDSFDEPTTMVATDEFAFTTEALPGDVEQAEQTESGTLTGAEAKSDHTLTPEILTTGVTGSSYVTGGTPSKSRPTVSTFRFTQQYAESVKMEFYDEADTPLTYENEVDTDPAATTTTYYTVGVSLDAQGTVRCVLTPYSGDVLTGTAGTPVTIYGPEMNPTV